MIQILALRESANGKKTEVWFEKGYRAVSVEQLFANPGTVLAKIPKDEQYNVYFTVADCDEAPKQPGEKGRRLVEQHHIPFDVDGLAITDPPDIGQLTIIAKVILKAIGVEWDKTAVLFSGGGLQFFVGVNAPITDVGEFDSKRVFYKAICSKIDAALLEAKIQGKADPSVWSAARLMRMPDTINRKPGRPERYARLLQGNIERIDFDLQQASGLPTIAQLDQVSPHVLKNFPEPDAKTILDAEKGCKFLSHCQISPEKVSEQEWYAMLSVTGRFKNGFKISHELSKGHPKYSQAETDNKINQALASSGPRTCKNINSLWGKCASCVHYNTSLVSPILIMGDDYISTAGTGFYHMIAGEHGPKRGKPDFEGLHKYFKTKYTYLALSDADALWKFNGKFYEELDKKEVMKFAQENFSPKPTENMRREFLSFVLVENMRDKDFFKTSVMGKMNFQNGVLDLETRTLHAHSPEYGFRGVLPCEYDEKAVAPTWSSFLDAVTASRKDLIAVLQEYMGYSFASMDCRGQKALALLGTGSNGKSTFNNVIRKLATKNGYSAINLKDMHNDQKRMMLEGKLLNFADENSMDAFKDSALFMTMVTGGDISVKKVYSQPYSYENTTKLIMNFNRLPHNSNTTDGFFRRLLIVPFDVKFSDELGNKDPLIEDKLSLELPGIFNWIMEGYDRYKKQGYKFTDAMEGKDILAEYRKDSDPVHTFMLEEVNFDSTDEIGSNRQELYTAFKSWCEDNGIKYYASSRRFFDEFRKGAKLMGLNDIDYRVRQDAVQMRMFRFIRLANTPKK